jgi:hypothetical protein
MRESKIPSFFHGRISRFTISFLKKTGYNQGDSQGTIVTWEDKDERTNE